MQPGAAVFPGDAFIPNSADPSDWGTYGAAQDAPLQVRSLHLWRESVREICKLRLPEPDVGCGARPSKGVVFSGEAPAATPAAPPVEQVVEWTLALSVEPTGKGAVKGFVQQATPPCAHTGPHTARRHTFLHAHTTSIPHKPTYTRPTQPYLALTQPYRRAPSHAHHSIGWSSSTSTLARGVATPSRPAPASKRRRAAAPPRRPRRSRRCAGNPFAAEGRRPVLLTVLPKARAGPLAL